MFQHRALRRPVWMLCSLCLALALTMSGVAAPQDYSTTTQHESPVKKRGKALVDFRDREAHVVVAYYYSQRNNDSRWLYFQSGVTTREDTVIHRDDITLRTPQGKVITLASQNRIADETDHIQQLLNNAKPVSHDIRSYFTLQNQFEDMQLFRLPFGPVIHNSFVVDRERVALGPLFFESPTGTWASGTYTLVVRHKNGSAELPIELGGSGRED